tara:strand:- start:428 stop:877 length:450 start_codon:yes stop_codon:yes gene_type:complete
MPIFGIDMIIFSREKGILMGHRINNPAKGKLFVPGGRVYKNERISEAFHRILLGETGLTYSFEETTSLGLYEHFYDVTSWSTNKCCTHYIIEARLIEIDTENIKIKINLTDQHSSVEWISLEDIASKDIHYYSKLYINRIKEIKKQLIN